jgi:DNA-binding FadR family transcriptional regulator
MDSSIVGIVAALATLGIVIKVLEEIVMAFTTRGMATREAIEEFATMGIVVIRNSAGGMVTEDTVAASVTKETLIIKL